MMGNPLYVNGLTHFIPLSDRRGPFCISSKYLKTSGFLMFSGNTEIDRWHEVRESKDLGIRNDKRMKCVVRYNQELGRVLKLRESYWKLLFWIWFYDNCFRGKLSKTNPKTNPKPNPNSNRRGIFLGGNCLVTPT